MDRNCLDYATIKHPRYIYYQKRLETFKNWPNLRSEPKLLAYAGFFYCERDDKSMCPFCGMNLYFTGWQTSQDPFLTHKKQAPSCQYVKMRVAADQSRLSPITGSPDRGSSHRGAVGSYDEYTRQGQTLSMNRTDESGYRDFDLYDEDNKLKKHLYCKVCFLNIVSIVFLPCGHLVCCFECTRCIESCLQCNTRITEKIPCSFT